MLHPSYSDLINVVNSEVEPGEEPIIQSRYSIAPSNKPLSIAVEELDEGKVKIVSENDSPEDEIPEDSLTNE